MPFYDVVVFDAAGTLVGRETPDHFEEYFVIAAQEVGYTISIETVRASVERIYTETKKNLSDTRMTTPTQARRYWVDLYEAVLHDAGIDGDIRAGIERFYDRFQEGDFLDVYSDVRPALDMLEKRGIRTGVLSNWSEHLEEILRRLGLRDCFEFVIVSAVVGCEKPDGQIFDLMVSATDVPRQRILYVGDDPEEDIHAAQDMGIDALLIDRYDRYGRFRLPSIRSLAEIQGYLGLENP